MIRVRNLVRKFGPLVALDDVSFDIEKGEVVGFLGVNGAGKSTTMRILTGYLPATRGSVEVCGFDVLRSSLEVRRRIGYLPEGVPLYREHRVEEMLRFQARLHGLSKDESKRRIGEVLERVELTERAKTPIGQLSKGLRQRAGIAVALLPAPEVLILDEPTSGLDPIQRIEVRNLILELAREHTVLLSSHILPEVEAVAPRLLILHQGKLAAQGTRDALVRELGSPSHVRLEVVCGPDPADALRLLGAIEGVREVKDRGRLGIHYVIDVFAEEDLREDVGAVCAAKNWALRELSWHAPTLEHLFARIALELGEDEAAAREAGPVSNDEPMAAPTLTSTLPQAKAPAEAAPSKKVPTLNPFQAPSQPPSEGNA